MLMGTVLVAAVFIVMANLVVDILRFAIDPRIRDKAV
jgi:ABC-type dipeptide/oligopeptide/nickel transport system permease component